MCTIIQYNNATTLSHMHTATVDKPKSSTVVPVLNYEVGGTRDTAPHFLHTHKGPPVCCVGPTCGLDIQDPSDKRDMGEVT